MEDKIEVNEYVRTKEGFIYKIENGEEFYEDSVDVGIGIIPDVDGIWIDRECLDYIDKRDIVKHSKQLIDLREQRDIVEDKYNTYEVAFIAGNRIYCNDYNYDDSLIVLEEKDIETILTKESYMANCYKVGGGENEASND